VLRGYGGALERVATATLVTAAHTAAEVGDEALLIARRAACAVAVGRDRAAATQRLIGAGVDVVIADDGLQHLRLQRDVEIIVVDGERGFGNGLLLPAGPLRESLQRLQTVDIVVQNGGARPLLAGALRMQVHGDSLRRVDGQGAIELLAAWRGREVQALAAIGNPTRFFALLDAAGLRVHPHVLPDHQALTAQDLQVGATLPLLMTEKDAVKCRDFAQSRHWYLPVQASFEAADAHHLLGRVMMEARLLDLLVCPLCKGPLVYDKPAQELVCRAERLAYPVREGIPVMLEEEARQLPSDDPRLER
jgi:tetraacyldisaccharide 4'-kinase